MTSRIKTRWSPAQWITFGNRVKQLRTELHSMASDVQHVCRARELDGLFKVLNQLDKWKCKMENVAAKDVPGVIVTRIFYGDYLPEDALDGIIDTAEKTC